MSRHKKKGLPDRWLDYKAVGKRLHGTRFIAFKVPLKQSFNCLLPHSEVFGPWELLDALNKDNQELGLIIDLTFTKRYYQIQDLPESLMLVKIFTAGHHIPSDDTILSFKRAVRRFLRDNADNDMLIGVHCTHGLNRTGYLICRYLIDVDGMDPKEAVKLFNSSRGHDIERQNYLQDLQRGRKRSNEGMEVSEQEPERGRATHRPSDSSEERRSPFSDPRQRRSFAPRGTNHSSQHHQPHNVLHPTPPLLPLPRPPFCPPVGGPASNRRYQWGPPEPDSHWRRPPRSEDSRHRYPPAEPDWPPYARRQEDRRRGPPPPRNRYSPRWTNESSGHDAPQRMWTGPRARHNHRVDTMDNYWTQGN